MDEITKRRISTDDFGKSSPVLRLEISRSVEQVQDPAFLRRVLIIMKTHLSNFETK